LLFLQTGLRNDNYQAAESKSSLLLQQADDNEVSDLLESSRHVNLPCTAADTDQNTQSSGMTTATLTGTNDAVLLINSNTDSSDTLPDGDDDDILTAGNADDASEAGLGDSALTSSLDAAVETAQCSEASTVDGTLQSVAFDRAFVATDQSLLDTTESTNDADRPVDIDSADSRDANSPLVAVEAVERGPVSFECHSSGVTSTQMTAAAAAAAADDDDDDDDDAVTDDAVLCACDTLQSLITLLKSTINSARSGISVMSHVLVGTVSTMRLHFVRPLLHLLTLHPSARFLCLY